MNTHASAAALRNSLGRRTMKLLLCTAGAAALAATAMASPAAASAGPVTGTGTTLCNAGYTGTMTFTTPLKNGGVAASCGTSTLGSLAIVPANPASAISQGKW